MPDKDTRCRIPVGVKHPIQEATKVGIDLVQDASPLLKSTPDVDDTQLSSSSKTIMKCAPVVILWNDTVGRFNLNVIPSQRDLV